jgi:hypothetical protein
MVELVQRYSKLPKATQLSHIGRASPIPIAPPRIHNAQKRLGPEVVAQLIADYQAGAPSTALMQTYGIGKGTVLKILEDHGVSRRNQPLADDEREEAIQLYLAGWSMAKVGRHYGRAHTVIRDMLRRHGVQRQPRECR